RRPPLDGQGRPHRAAGRLDHRLGHGRRLLAAQHPLDAEAPREVRPARTQGSLLQCPPTPHRRAGSHRPAAAARQDAMGELMSDQRHDHSAEIGVLAACLQTHTARQEARRYITGADFFNPHHEDIWEAINHLDRTGTAVDALTVNGALAGKSALTLMPEIVTTLALPDNVGEYAAIVRGWATKRRVE